MNSYRRLYKLGVLSLVTTFLFVTGGAYSSFFKVSAQTKNYTLDQLDVKIQVNKDSTMDISEKLSYTFNDEMNGMFREITLEDKDKLDRCRENEELLCGGFTFIQINKVLVNGEEVEEGRYEIFEKYVGSEKRLRVQYAFDNAPISLSNEKYTFQVDYTVLGGLGFFEEYDLFYWNTIFPDRDKSIAKTNVEITYPGKVSLAKADSQVLSTGGQEYEYEQVGNLVKYRTVNIPPHMDFTVIQKVPKGMVMEPAKIKLNLNPDGQKLSYKDFTIEVSDDQLVEGIPAGDIELKFSKNLYHSKTVPLSLKSGQTQNVDVKLELTTLGTIVYIAIAFANVALCCLGLFAPLWLYFWWWRKGRDKGLKTVIPEFSPPNEMKPYLLGALKDERVDNADISSTIIDLAYRGHIKIIEGKKGLLGSRDYTLQRLETKDDLDPIEQKVMDMLFSGTKTEVKLSSLKNKAYQDLENIRKSVYEVLVDKKFFSTNPNSKRNNWLGAGIAVLVIGMIASVFLSMIAIFTGFFLAAGLGIGLIIISRYIPAKTALGGEMLTHIRGFKMYLETAEKYTLQNLTPEMFEKYLSYAIVFGVEKQWAEKFADIYKGSPDWYQPADGNTFNTILFANSLNNFSSQSSSVAASRPSSSSSGSGWSGGDGFSGGFSGGGGGGGGGGAW